MINSPPLVSVIIPVYNVIEYIYQCLESVKKQKYENLEILVIDDGSIDGSGQICDAFALEDTRFKVFHTKNNGLSAARNLGLESRHGKYIFFLDSDDWLEPEAISNIVSIIEKSDVDIVACRCFREWANKTKVSTLPNKYKEYDGEEAVLDFVRYGYIGQGVWNKIYKSSLFDTIRFPVGRVYEDITVSYSVLNLAKKIIFIPDMLVHYRMRQSSICNTKSLNSLIDWWISRFLIYNEVKWKEAECNNSLVKECIWGGTMLWLRFIPFSTNITQNENRRVKRVIKLIHTFAREHFSEVIIGRFSIKYKLMCTMLLSSNPVYWKMLSIIYKVFMNVKNRYITNEKLVMFP